MKKVNKLGGFYFHATDDIPEIRKLFYDFILTVDLSFQAVVAQKSIDRFVKKHHSNEKEFYADLLSHLLHDKLEKGERNVLIVSQRGSSTRIDNLENGLLKAIERLKIYKPGAIIQSNVVFDVQNPLSEPLLNIADYLCWTVQRKFEKNENRFYDYVKPKIDNIIEI